MFILRICLIIICLLLSIQGIKGQQLFPILQHQSGTDQEDDTIRLNEAIIISSRIFRNDTDRYHYNQMKHYVKMVLPYVNEAVSLFYDIDQKSADLSRKARRQYIRGREREIREKFEDRLRNLNITQGRLLVKLIHRQLDLECYDILRELKNPLTAAYYQSVARFNGINLNEDYLPEENRELERILRNLGYSSPQSSAK